MQNTPTLRALLLTCGAALTLCQPAQADFNPVDLTPSSFNADVVVEKTAPPSFSTYMTATMDGGTNRTGQTFFERGFHPIFTNIGIPKAGTTFVAQDDPNRTFQMAPSYVNANNALLVYTNGNGKIGGRLTFAAPAAFTSLSFVGASAGGAALIDVTVNYAGGGTQAGQITVPDWFNQTPIAVTANGRTSNNDGRINDVNSGNPRLLFFDLGLSDSVNNVTSIDFVAVGPNRAAIFAVSGTTDGSTFNPITITGYNYDMVVEAGAILTGSRYDLTTVTLDGGTNRTGNTFYEAGFNTNANALTTGIPVAGSNVTDGFHTFTMAASYTTNNAVFIGPYEGYTTGSFTPITPQAFTGLSFLNAAGNGPVAMDVTVSFQDGTTELLNFSSPDWFGNDANTFYRILGRFDVGTLALNNVNDAAGNPRLHTNDLALANTTALVTNISFTYVSGGRAAIMAVAGQTTAGGVFSPVAVTGYNADVVAEKEKGNARVPAPLNATSVSMDGGVNNTGNSWFEQGYFSHVPNAGLPPAGSTITSLAQPDHHYKFAASYTANNAVYVDLLRSNANLTIATPVTYSALSFLSATANGNVTNQAIMQYQDGTSETNTFVSRDWFNNTPYAFSANGRVQVENRTINNVVYATATPNPRLYEAQFALGNTASALTNIVLRYLGGAGANSRMVVLAVSATAGSFGPILTDVLPSPAGAYAGQNLMLTATVLGGTPPVAYRWQYLAPGSANFVNVNDGGVISGATTTNLTFTGITTAQVGQYRLTATNAAGYGISQVASVSVLSALQDITTPGDLITRINGTVGGNGTEGEPNAINNNTSKYLNFDDVDTAAPFVGPVGFIVQPSLGQTTNDYRTVVRGIRVFTANDAEERDPVDFSIEGSDDFGTWSLIASNALALPAARNAANTNALNPLLVAGQEVTFSNSKSYLYYRVQFYNVKNNSTANSMQVAEIELLGIVGGDQAEQPIITISTGTGGNLVITTTGDGTLQSTTNLTAPIIWADEGPISGTTTITPDPAQPAKYYRVSIP